MDKWDKVIDKFLSARYAMVLLTTITYCLAILSSILMVILGKMTVEVFLALFSGFSALVIYIAQSYFSRKRKDEENGHIPEDKKPL